MKNPLIVLIFALFTALPAVAKEDAPRGFVPLTEIKSAQAEATSGKKLLVLVVQGMNDQCPNCAAALENGLRAVGSGVVKVYARAETIAQGDKSNFPPVMQERVKQNFSTGASVTFVVFDPEMTKIVAEADRSQLQNDKKAIAAFKTSVQDAKKALK
jgi:hypothetical protein